MLREGNKITRFDNTSNDRFVDYVNTINNF